MPKVCQYSQFYMWYIYEHMEETLEMMIGELDSKFLKQKYFEIIPLTTISKSNQGIWIFFEGLDPKTHLQIVFHINNAKI